MNINETFPSKWIKAADLQGKAHLVKMNYVKLEEIGEDRKPVLYFIGKERGLVLNKTNANVIAMMYGPDTENWGGGEIEIYPTETDFQGKRVSAIRVKMPTRQIAPQNGQPDHIAPNARNRAAESSLTHRPFAPLDAEPAVADFEDDPIPF
jgi:hypothetical protein